MLLKINHQTHYQYSAPVVYALQQLRLRPPSNASQTILDWGISLEGAQQQAHFADQHGNQVDLVQIQHDVSTVMLTISGHVETINTNGILGPHTLAMPLWFYLRQTPLTEPGMQLKDMVAELASTPRTGIDLLHALSHFISSKVAYRTGETGVKTSAEEALRQGSGVCQDHTHIFLGAARALGFPARYVSGYLMMNDCIDQDASHAWAEAYIEGLGWVGFDVSNAISPDERYVQIASALDYRGAAPTSGFVVGAARENLIVSVQVQQ